jgi:DNA mismatch endonuclease, patch repair protein
MKNIGPKNTKQEILVGNLVRSLGFKYFTHLKNLPGTPDLVFPRRKKAIFINGCFWHGHNKCKRSKLPTTNRAFWRDKINANKLRDKKNRSSLSKLGWNCCSIWQCAITKTNETKLKRKILKFILAR